MKFLQCANLSYLNSLLDGTDAGDCILNAKLEAYSCKSIKTDKRLSHLIERRLVEEAQLSMTFSPDLHPAESPVDGPASLSLDNSPLDLSRLDLGTNPKANLVQTYTFLVLCLNHCYNHEFDFSCIPQEDFAHEESLCAMKSTINSILTKFTSTSLSVPRLQEEFWNALNDVVNTPECELWTYMPEEGEDPIQEMENSTLWSKHYFFYNKKQKKILLFRCWAQSKGVSRGENDGDYISEDYDDDDYYEPNMKNIGVHFGPRDVLENDDDEDPDDLMFH